MSDHGIIEAVMAYSTMLGRVASLVGGYKTQLIEAGLTSEAAEEMAVAFHDVLISVLMHPHDPKEPDAQP